MKEISCSKNELVKLFLSKRLIKKNYIWYLDNVGVRIYAVYNKPSQYIKDINDTDRYKIQYIQKD